MTAKNCTGFQWTKARLEAAVLVAEDALSHDAIAARVGISPRQLSTWRQAPEFQAKVQEELDKLEAALLRFPIARKRERVAAYQRVWAGLQQVLDERAAAPDMANIPGGSTGLLVKEVKFLPSGRVERYEVDGGTLKELRATAEQAAKELGQWVDKQALTDAKGGTLDLAAIVLAARTSRPEAEA